MPDLSMLAAKQRQVRDWTKRILLEVPSPNAFLAGSDQQQQVTVALNKLGAGDSIDDSEATAIETIVLPQLRPALPVMDGVAGSWPPAWSRLNESSTRERLQRGSGSVGLLRSTAPSTVGRIATAFLVSPDLLMTTWHSAAWLAPTSGNQNPGFTSGIASLLVDFGGGGETDREITCGVTEIVMLHPYLDIALLRIEPNRPMTPLELWARDPSDMVNSDIAVIGYPGWDPRYGSELQQVVFGGKSWVKRIMPGRVLSPRLRSSRDHQQMALTHDALTVGGKSGAPVIDIATGRVVGVSYQSEYLIANYAVPMSELALDRRVWDAGLRFADAAPPDFAPPWEEYWKGTDAGSPSSSLAAPARGVPYATSSSSPEAMVSAAEHEISERFPEVSAFRHFLLEHGYGEVVEAVPEKAGTSELIRALQRRGAIDESFLQALGVGTAPAPVRAPEYESLFEPWLSEPMLGRVAEVLASIGPQIIEVLATGSRFRSYLIDSEGEFQNASKTIKRLAMDSRPEAGKALASLLRRFFESIQTADEEWVKTLSAAATEVEGKTESSDSEMVEAAASYATLNDPPRMQSLVTFKAGLEAARSVIAIRFTEGKYQRTGSSGWLLTPSLVVVPAHVLKEDSRGVTRGQSQNEKAREGAVLLDFDAPAEKGRNLQVDSLLWSDDELDLALLRLAEPVLDRRPLELRPDPPEPDSSSLQLIHHPFLGPKQVSVNGRLIRHDGHDVLYLLDTSPGSAGAPVFDEHWRVIATHRAFQFFRRGPDDEPIRAKLGTATSALLARLRKQDVWREIVASHPALKMVDANVQRQLYEMGEGHKVPVVVRLFDASATLEDIAGFHVDSRSELIATGVADRNAISAMLVDPAVESIEISRPASSLEFEDTVPYIGAANIHSAPHMEKGERALIAVIDTGVDILHEAFRDDAGKTRVLAFWDQLDARAPSGESQAPAPESAASDALARQLGLRYGAVYFADDLQRFIAGLRPLPPTVPSIGGMSHGTAVCSIAAGRMSGGGDAEAFAGGVAPDARLIVVRYDLNRASVGYSKGHIESLPFIDQYATMLGLPVVVNISNGMNSGAHNGTTTLEIACDMFTENGTKPGRTIVKSAGNERLHGRHAVLDVANGSMKRLRWRSQPKALVAPGQDPEVFELWFHYLNRYRFCVRCPSGGKSPPMEATVLLHKLNEYLPNGNLLNAMLTQSHREGDGLLSFSVEPGKAATVERGGWELETTGLQVVNNESIHAWTEKLDNRDVYFQNDAKDDCTITIPGTALSVISVGAIRPGDVMELYDHSSAGPTRKGREKPEIVAPGVSIYGAGADRINLRSRESGDGTSLSAPHVTGAIALALSARLKAGRLAPNSSTIRQALIETARHRSGMIWHRETGYGELDAMAFFDNIMDPLSP